MEDHERASVQASEHLGVQTRKRGEHSKHLGQLKCSLILDKAEKKRKRSRSPADVQLQALLQVVLHPLC